MHVFTTECEKLINEGMMSGEDKVSELIPGFKAYYDSSEAEITVDDLLKQQSGYTNIILPSLHQNVFKWKTEYFFYRGQVFFT